MSRRAARITHDEVTRMVRAVQGCGLVVSRVSFDGTRVDVIIGELVDKRQNGVDDSAESNGLIREPQL